MKIGDREVGPGHPCYIIAEVGLAHEGSVGMAHAFVEAVAGQGVDAVKFQCHDGQPDQPWRSTGRFRADRTRREYWDRTGFTRDQWESLAMDAKRWGLDFLCSPFSVEAVEVLKDLVPAWKIASGQVTNLPMLKAAGKTGKPGIISCGFAPAMDLGAPWQHFREYAILESTPIYPTTADAAGLDRLLVSTSFPSGLSDHSGTIYPGIAAAALGANILEVHVTMSRHAYGPDVAASLTIEELGRLVEGVRFVERAMQPMSEEARAQVEEMRSVYMA